MPLHLLERIVLMSTDEGDLVLDPFLGTGTSAIAAKSLGRNFIGFELDKKYVDISESKLYKTFPNSKIGDTWISVYRNDVVTVRNQDWNKLEQYYFIPEPKRNIDHTNIQIRDRSMLPVEAVACTHEGYSKALKIN